ncbi:hypothetical protein [Ureibacillus acetophenoni]|uniref:Uncharacterized protein n=1 Tax=Ureibacillus acetophenoni TaxID=614649 RepID=A0A285UPW8_9BACL|nr:hypothetical protein [Ureibacillus acetophenoni]SOC43872.1 hypothetical protein SAMN05877842_11782 [Ureibacillus acetophenoni]
MNKLIELLRHLFRMKPKNVGTTIFAPIKILPEYLVDEGNGKVIGVVKHNEKVYLTVVVDVLNRKTKVQGSLRRIRNHTNPFRKSHYIEMIQREAHHLIHTNRSK